MPIWVAEVWGDAGTGCSAGFGEILRGAGLPTGLFGTVGGGDDGSTNDVSSKKTPTNAMMETPVATASRSMSKPKINRLRFVSLNPSRRIWVLRIGDGGPARN